MDGKHFLLSSRLLLKNGSHEADFRSAITRAYYACFLETRKLTFDNCDKKLLSQAGFREEKKLSHDSLIKNLQKSSDIELRNLGVDLNGLRGKRIEADYDLATHFSSNDAKDTIEDADEYLMSLSKIDIKQIRTLYC